MIEDSGNPKYLDELSTDEFDRLAARAVEVFRNFPPGLVVSAVLGGSYSPIMRWSDAGSIIETLKCSLTYDPDIEAFAATTGKHSYVHSDPRRALTALFIIQVLGNGPYVVPSGDPNWKHARVEP